ncbi:MAG: hypothetical protein LBU46_05110, partial [Candidatus Accumulibacter sp.]|nr:hypothetical protein [Accumulibacter sp.]
ASFVAAGVAAAALGAATFSPAGLAAALGAATFFTAGLAAAALGATTYFTAGLAAAALGAAAFFTAGLAAALGAATFFAAGLAAGLVAGLAAAALGAAAFFTAGFAAAGFFTLVAMINLLHWLEKQRLGDTTNNSDAICRTIQGTSGLISELPVTAPASPCRAVFAVFSLISRHRRLMNGAFSGDETRCRRWIDGMAGKKTTGKLAVGAEGCRQKNLAAAIVVAMQSCYIRLMYTIGTLPKIGRQITTAGCSKQYYDKRCG